MEEGNVWREKGGERSAEQSFGEVKAVALQSPLLPLSMALRVKVLNYQVMSFHFSQENLVKITSF